MTDWKETTVEDSPLTIIDGDRGKNYPNIREFSSSGHCLFLNAGNVTNDGFKFNTCNFITESKDYALRKGKVKRHDSVLTTRGTVGNVAYYDESVPYEDIRINSGMVILRPSSEIHPRYLYVFLKSNVFQNQVKAYLTGSAQPQLPIRDINMLKLKLPPLPEQKRIAHIYGSLDDKIELNRRMNETLEGIARALFKSWFVDFDPVKAKGEGRDPKLPKEIADLFPDSFEESELGMIPKGWRVGEIGNAVSVLGGGTPRTKEPAYWEGGIHPFCTPKDMSNLTSTVLLDTERHITDAGVNKISSRQLPHGTVLMSSRAPIGYLAIVEVPVSVNQGIIAMVCDGQLPNHYILYWTKTNMDIIEARANGSTFMEISKRNFRTIPILIPSEQILKAFVDTVAPCHRQVVQNLYQSNTLVKLRDILLPKLIFGELGVEDIKD